MRVDLSGIASATKKLASGEKVTYYYAWRGGPRLKGELGSPEFVSSYEQAHRTLHGSLQGSRRRASEPVTILLLKTLLLTPKTDR